MDATSWYAWALATLVLGPVLPIALIVCISTLKDHSKHLFLKYLYYPQPPAYLQRSGRVTWFHVLILIAFLTANVIAMSIGVSSLTDLNRRCGTVSVVNLVPLFLGGRLDITSRYGIGLQGYARMHRWLGRVAIVEALAHTIISGSTKGLDIKVATDIAGLAATIILALLLVSGCLRYFTYEMFLNIHFVLSLAVVASLYLHFPVDLRARPAVYLLAASILLVSVRFVRFGQVIYRNFRYGKALTRASLRTITFKRSVGEDIPLSDAVHLHVRLLRPWKHRAGQYVYLCMPGVSRTSFAQLHPYYVAWWYEEGGQHYVVLLIQRRRGFTNNVYSRAKGDSDSTTRFIVLLEGPYGAELTLESYGTVLLFATGIGIAGQLSYVSQILQAYRNHEAKTRMITLFWQVESEVQTAWVADRMQQLLKQDVDKILDIHIYVLGNFLSGATGQGDYVQIGERIDMTYSPMGVQEAIQNKMKQRKGRTVISVCADKETSCTIRQVVHAMEDYTVSLKELDFDPPRNPSSGIRDWWRYIRAFREGSGGDDVEIQ